MSITILRRAARSRTERCRINRPGHHIENLDSNDAKLGYHYSTLTHELGACMHGFMTGESLGGIRYIIPRERSQKYPFQGYQASKIETGGLHFGSKGMGSWSVPGTGVPVRQFSQFGDSDRGSDSHLCIRIRNRPAFPNNWVRLLSWKHTISGLHSLQIACPLTKSGHASDLRPGVRNYTSKPLSLHTYRYLYFTSPGGRAYIPAATRPPAASRPSFDPPELQNAFGM